MHPEKCDLPDMAVTVRHFDCPAGPHAHVIPFEVSDNPQGLFVGRPIVGQLGPFRVIVHVAVVDREMVEGHESRVAGFYRRFCRVANIAPKKGPGWEPGRAVSVIQGGQPEEG